MSDQLIRNHVEMITRKGFLAAACFSSLGGVIGMQLLHHKTQHWYFKVFFPVLLILQIAALAVGAYFLFR